MGWKPEDVALLKRSKKDIKNVDHMIINHDIATVREFMICKVKVWKGYFCPPPAPPPPPLQRGGRKLWQGHCHASEILVNVPFTLTNAEVRDKLQSLSKHIRKY